MIYVFRKKTFAVSMIAFALLAVTWLWVCNQNITGAQDAGSARTRSYTLRHASAAEVTPRLRTLLSELVDGVSVSMDTRANTVSIHGNEETQRVAEKLLETLDHPLDHPLDRVAGKTGGAVGTKDEPPVVKGYRVDSDDLDAVAARLRGQFQAEPGVRIAPDSRTKQLVVVAPQRVHDRVAAQLNSGGRAADIAAAPTSKTLNVNVGTNGPYQLRNISVVELENGLKRIWGPSVAFVSTNNRDIVTAKIPSTQPEPALVQIDRKKGQVSFTGATEARREWQQIVQTLDHERLPMDSDAQVLPIHRADPEQIRRTLNVVQASFGGKKGEQVAAAVPVRKTVRGERNAELVARNFQNAAQPNNAPPANNAQPNNAQPPAAPNQPPAADDKKPDDGDDDDDSGLIGNVQIEFLEGLDVIIVRGKKRDVERVTKIINDIERLSAETRPAIEVLQLEHVNSQAVSEVVIQVYDQILSARQGRVSITALGKPNAILLIGRPESIAIVVELIKKLDHPVTAESLWQVFPLKYASVVEAEQTVSKLFGGTTGAAGGTTGAAAPPPTTGGAAGGPAGAGGALGGSAGSTATLKPRLTIVSDFRSNSLVVLGSPRDLDDVAQLIKQIDVESNTATTELRIFKLQNTMAQEMAPILQGAIRGQTTAGAGGANRQPTGPFQGTELTAGAGGANAQNQARSTNLQFVTVDPQGNKVIATGIPSDIVVSADVTANALVVRAPAKSMELIGALIRELDSLPDAQSQIKVFTVVNGDATNLAAMLQQLFGQQVTIGRGSGGLFGAGAAGALNIAPQGGANAGESSLVPLRFAVDVRSNSVMASGSAGDLAVVETLLLRLDEGDVPSRKMTVYRLKNAFAEDVANSITQFLQSQRQVIQQNQLFNQAIGPFEQLEREMVVVAEPQTNSLVVSATPKFYEDIMRIIKQLDFRPPMVMVQVLIAEVNLNDLYEFGVELGLQESLLFDRGKSLPLTANGPSNPGFNFNNSTGTLPNSNSLNQNTLAGQALSNFATGRANSTLGYGGLVLSAASDSVNILVRALQDTGRLQVLSRPQVMAIHNRQAQVLVGQKVPRVQGTTQTNTGITQDIVDVDIGLILNIIPQINDDGIVVLNVQAENSKLGDSVLQIPSPSGPTNLRSIDTTSAVTTISARDGQTVVFAGLITTQKQLIVRRVPYLSDIPVLGKLFQFQSNNNTRKELLIVMTPQIVKTDEDYDWLKAVESDRMNWCLGDVVNVHGDVGLRGNNCLFCPEHIPVVYPDQDPAAQPQKVRIRPEELQKPGGTPPATKMTPADPFAPPANLNKASQLPPAPARGPASMAQQPEPTQVWSGPNGKAVPNVVVGTPATRDFQTEVRDARNAYPGGGPSGVGIAAPEPPALPAARQQHPVTVGPAFEPLSAAKPGTRYPIAPAGYDDNRNEQVSRLPSTP